MSVEASKKILKVMGIISIVFGAIALIAAVILLLGVGASVAMGIPEQLGVSAGSLWFAAILPLVAAIVTLLLGIFCVIASKKTEKAMPVIVLACLDIILSIVSMILTIKTSESATSTIVSTVISVALSVLIFLAANTLKKSNG